MIKKNIKKNCIRYHSPDFRFSLTSTSDLVLLTLKDRLLMDLIRASGIRENLGESTLFSGIKKFFTANIFIVPESIKITWRFSRSKKNDPHLFPIRNTVLFNPDCHLSHIPDFQIVTCFENELSGPSFVSVHTPAPMLSLVNYSVLTKRNTGWAK